MVARARARSGSVARTSGHSGRPSRGEGEDLEGKWRGDGGELGDTLGSAYKGENEVGEGGWAGGEGEEMGWWGGCGLRGREKIKRDLILT